MTRIISFREALRETLAERMSQDRKVLLIGEDIGLYGGAFGVTRGLFERFPDQIIETPISENSFAGLALGAAMAGYRPVVEFMFMDFVSLAMDQIVDHAAKVHYVYGGQLNAPMVIRLPGGGGRGYGASHSQSLEGWFIHTPGLIVLSPTTPQDAKGLLHSAMDENSPVIFVENKLLYDTKGHVPERPFRTPIGQLSVAGRGEDVTIAAYGRMMLAALEARDILAELDISAEVLDLRSLKPLDADGIIESVSRTGQLVIVSEAPPSGGVAAEVAAVVAENCFDRLRAPVLRISALDTPIPSSMRLEARVFPTAERIVESVTESFKQYRYKGSPRTSDRTAA